MIVPVQQTFDPGEKSAVGLTSSSYFAAPATGLHAKAGSDWTVAPDAGLSSAGVPSPAAVVGVAPIRRTAAAARIPAETTLRLVAMLIERAQRPQSCLGPSPSVGAYAPNIGVGAETANPSAEGIVQKPEPRRKGSEKADLTRLRRRFSGQIDRKPIIPSEGDQHEEI